jgi:hypothetical protein
MADDIRKSCSTHSALALVLSLFCAGCTTATYNSNLPPGPPKPADYPILLYAHEMKVPRPCEIIGTMSIKAGSFTVSGGTMEKELKTVMQRAHENGADAVRLTAIEKPSYTNPNFSLTADLLRYTDAWETVAISPNEFQAYLDAHQRDLDPIEGIWILGGLNPHAIGIMKSNSKPGRDFVGFILNSQNPVWRFGSKKMDIRRGLKAGSYILTYYLDDFEPCEVSFILGQNRAFMFTIRRTEADDTIIIYSKR